MNMEKLKEMTREKLIPAIASSVGAWSSQVTVQMDSAGGHGGGKGKMEGMLQALNDLFPVHTGKQITITFVTQPTKSPDLNVLDLGAWNSIQAGEKIGKCTRN
mmetsp:Transcript_10333/g.25992  ORF Transcript_10333/g.25992 Transcript_10333/m.25992 type:complete len:103 (-) Transcript_10333:41-349(-)